MNAMKKLHPLQWYNIQFLLAHLWLVLNVGIDMYTMVTLIFLTLKNVLILYAYFINIDSAPGDNIVILKKYVHTTIICKPYTSIGPFEKLGYINLIGI